MTTPNRPTTASATRSTPTAMIKPGDERAEDRFVRITRNPYQRAAGACMFLAVVVAIAGAPAAAPIAGGLAVVFALIAVVRRDQY
jgi:hypothetical protein